MASSTTDCVPGWSYANGEMNATSQSLTELLRRIAGVGLVRPGSLSDKELEVDCNNSHQACLRCARDMFRRMLSIHEIPWCLPRTSRVYSYTSYISLASVLLLLLV